MSKRLIIAGVITAAAGVAAFGIYRYYQNQIQRFKDMKYFLKKFDLVNYSGDQATLNITLQIYNPSTFDAHVNAIYFDISVNGQKLGFIQDISSFYVPAKAYSDDLPFSLTFSPKLLAADAFQLLKSYIQNSDYSINFNGYISVRSAFINITEPFDYTTTLKEILAP